MDWAVILAGGSGTRFWPLSSPRRPKQLLPLIGDVPTARGRRACRGTAGHRAAASWLWRALISRRELARALDLPADQVLVEPKPASTAPALAWATATALARDPSATVLSMHADWHLPTRGIPAHRGRGAGSRPRARCPGDRGSRPDAGRDRIRAHRAGRTASRPGSSNRALRREAAARGRAKP